MMRFFTVRLTFGHMLFYWHLRHGDPEAGAWRDVLPNDVGHLAFTRFQGHATTGRQKTTPANRG